MVPFGPCPTVPAGHGIQGAWLPAGEEIEPAIFARASRLTAVSMDMTGGYAASVREHAPQATIVIDNYHVVQLATKALDEVRREHWNELRSTGETDAAKQFKHDRWALLKNPEDLSDRQAATLQALRAAGGEGRARLGNEGDGPRDLRPRPRRRRCRRADRPAPRSPLPQPPQTVRQARTHDPQTPRGDPAARRMNLSNARAEALNNKVKLIVRRAYGFHSANAALALIHLTCGHITLQLPHEQAFA